jgi:DNA-binding transcriptional LysR family regulator
MSARLDLAEPVVSAMTRTAHTAPPLSPHENQHHNLGVMMHERELRAFALIAEIGRMDMAAKHLGYSQPAISYQIKCLEQSLRAKLLIRNTLGARLTPEGRMILPSVKAVLALLDGMKEVSAPAKASPGGHDHPVPPHAVPGRAIAAK